MRFISAKSFSDYCDDELLRSAVERKVEIIGEAARGVSKAFQTNHPEIPWSWIIKQRHVLAHDYGEIKHGRIWQVAIVSIPELIRLLPLLVRTPPSDAD